MSGTRTAPEVVQRSLADLIAMSAESVHSGADVAVHANRARLQGWLGATSVTEPERRMVDAMCDMLANEVLRRREESQSARHRGEESP